MTHHERLAELRYKLENCGDLGAAKTVGRWVLTLADELVVELANRTDLIQALERTVARHDAAEARMPIPDESPGDVIAAYEDGTIVLDDSLTTWNPRRAFCFVQAMFKAEQKGRPAALARVAELEKDLRWYRAECQGTETRFALECKLAHERERHKQTQLEANANEEQIRELTAQLAASEAERPCWPERTLRGLPPHEFTRLHQQLPWGERPTPQPVGDGERETLLLRLVAADDRIGAMCKEHRGPRMSIPAREDDDDLYISRALRHAVAMLRADAERIATLEAALNNATEGRWARWELERGELDSLISLFEFRGGFEWPDASQTQQPLAKRLLTVANEMRETIAALTRERDRWRNKLAAISCLKQDEDNWCPDLQRAEDEWCRPCLARADQARERAEKEKA